MAPPVVLLKHVSLGKAEAVETKTAPTADWPYILSAPRMCDTSTLTLEHDAEHNVLLLFL